MFELVKKFFSIINYHLIIQSNKKIIKHTSRHALIIFINNIFLALFEAYSLMRFFIFLLYFPTILSIRFALNDVVNFRAFHDIWTNSTTLNSHRFTFEVLTLEFFVFIYLRVSDMITLEFFVFNYLRVSDMKSKKHGSFVIFVRATI